jgi:hypothetical protein
VVQIDLANRPRAAIAVGLDPGEHRLLGQGQTIGVNLRPSDR